MHSWMLVSFGFVVLDVFSNFLSAGRCLAQLLRKFDNLCIYAGDMNWTYLSCQPCHMGVLSTL